MERPESCLRSPATTALVTGAEESVGRHLAYRLIAAARAAPHLGGHAISPLDSPPR